MLVGNSDVDVGREVSSIELRREVLVHVERVRVDVQFMASELVSESANEGRKDRYVLSDSHDVVGQVEHEFVGLGEVVSTIWTIGIPSMHSHLVPIYDAWREAVRKASAVMQIPGIDQEKVDVFFLDLGLAPPSQLKTA